MKSPVWFLLGRLSDLVGGGGYHRAYIIDNFVNSFSAWWLAGTNETSEWMPTTIEGGGADITNQFVADGLNGGLLELILSITLIVRCFQAVKRAMQTLGGSEPASERFYWALGATLVGNIGVLFSVTYFDQMHVIWYFLLASIASATSKNLSKTDNPDFGTKPLSINPV